MYRYIQDHNDVFFFLQFFFMILFWDLWTPLNRKPLLIGDVVSVDVLHHEIMDAQIVKEIGFDKKRERK